jgi:hypothetical protein
VAEVLGIEEKKAVVAVPAAVVDPAASAPAQA